MCVNTANFDNLGDDAVGYVYKWTYNGPVEKVKGKYYIGRRKIRGNVENYNHSSGHNQFRHYCSLPESNFHYEILFSSPDWSKVVNKEADLLGQCVGLDPLTWNLHKPYTIIEENDEAVQNLYNNIMDSILFY